MSFSSLAKEELLRLPLGKNCCVMSELSALVQTSGSLQLRGGGRVRVTFRVESAGLARRIFRLLGAGLELTPRAALCAACPAGRPAQLRPHPGG